MYNIAVEHRAANSTRIRESIHAMIRAGLDVWESNLIRAGKVAENIILGIFCYFMKITNHVVQLFLIVVTISMAAGSVIPQSRRGLNYQYALTSMRIS